MLKEAKDQCDYLIVGLQADPSIDREEKNKPVQNIVERYTQLKAVKYVDEIIPYVREKDLEDILQMYRIDVRVIGEEYKDKEYTGREICESKGIRVHYNRRDHRFSTSQLRRQMAGRV